MKLTRLLQDRILGPVAEWNLIYFLVEVSEASGYDAAFEVVDCVNVFAGFCTDARRNRTPIGKE